MKKFAIALAFLLLCGLGTWQLFRLQEKEAFLAHLAERSQHPAVDIDQLARENSPAPDLDGRKVKISGTFWAAPQFRLMSRVHNGQVGVHVLSVLQSTNSGFWLVNRGWVPVTQTELPPPPQGPVTVEGIALLPPPVRPFTPAPNPAHNEWYAYSPNQMVGSAQIQAPAAPWVIEAETPLGENIIPIGGRDRISEIPNNHLQYAFTWFSLAGILLLMAFIAHRRNK